ncbi:uncharacterized protein LOC141901971 [Tubulanus polymorphus]|uniref:uncharacterized protein LOC141901971 n=1 Tax=Tubulanus polymorphus TaxID=672921 RepID=UPI003DA21453
MSSTQLLSSPATAAAAPTSVPTSCCEGGRPIITDPHTGQTVCSCRYSTSLLAGYPAARVPGIADTVYSSAAYASQAAAGYGAFAAADPSAFYSPLNSAYGLKDNMEAWRSLSQPAACYPYDTSMAAYPYMNSYGAMDLNGARRKNATRESTSTLKAWLQEHIKNPYPTKGEKIMLAIITKMTLTQVSTWFANARRRLKKENKMTWSPKNRCDDDDDDDKLCSDDDDEKDDHNRSGSRLGDQQQDGDLKQLGHGGNSRVNSPDSEHPSHSPVLNSDSNHSNHIDIVKCGSTSNDSETNSDKLVTSKPKIWSLADTATSKTPPMGRRSPIGFSAVPTASRANCTHPVPISAASLDTSSMWSKAAIYPGYPAGFARYGLNAMPYASSGKHSIPSLPEDHHRTTLTHNGAFITTSGADSRVAVSNGFKPSENLVHPAFGISTAFRPIDKSIQSTR